MTTGEPLVLAAVAVAAGALMFVGLLAARRRPPRIRAEHTRAQLPDDRPPPAIVNLVTEGFEVTRAAPSATLLDLAARRHLDLERYDGHTICRLRDRNRDTRSLTGYEHRVLARLRQHADGDTVPAAALGFGHHHAADRWFRGFAQEVIDDAQRRGLCHDRWTWQHVVAIGATGVLVFVLAGLADAADQTPSALGESLRLAAVLGAFALWGIAGRMLRSLRQLPHAPGQALAEQWVAVRTALAERGTLDDRPAAGVVVWGPHLVYGAAMGLAADAVGDLPLGLDEDEHAWSVVTGRWRHVRVRYPRLRPGWGLHPARALLRGLVLGGAAGAVIWGIREVATTAGADVASIAATLTPPVTAIALTVGAYAVTVATAGLADLFATREVEGIVLRRRERSFVPRRLRPLWDGFGEGPSDPREQPGNRRYLAVDDGRADELTAWCVRPRVFGTCREGERVRVRVTPRLGYVRTVEG